MSLPMDPVMRLSYVNTQLRDNYESLDALCSDLDLDRKALEESLAVIDYHYNKELNQFR